jgi:hypothetical protein
MNEHRFIVLDQLSRNQLGEFATLTEAEACFLRFVDADATAVEHLEIWDDDEDIRLDAEPDRIRSEQLRKAAENPAIRQGENQAPIATASLDVSSTDPLEDEFEYVLLDRWSNNFLGEWHTFEEAEKTYLEYLSADPHGVERLELWHEDKRVHVDPAKISVVRVS